jgi:hypothetical protein
MELELFSRVLRFMLAKLTFYGLSKSSRYRWTRLWLLCGVCSNPLPFACPDFAIAYAGHAFSPRGGVAGIIVLALAALLLPAIRMTVNHGQEFWIGIFTAPWAFFYRRKFMPELELAADPIFLRLEPDEQLAFIVEWMGSRKNAPGLVIKRMIEADLLQREKLMPALLDVWLRRPELREAFLDIVEKFKAIPKENFALTTVAELYRFHEAEKELESIDKGVLSQRLIRCIITRSDVRKWPSESGK